MDQVQPKMGLISFIPQVLSITEIFLNAKTFKMRTKIDAGATGDIIGLNDNEQEPGSINKDSDVTDDQ